MNAGRSIKARTFDKKTAQASKTSKRPRYIGLRVSLKTPDVTNEDAFSGLMGLTVVLARRNDATPMMLVATPARTKIPASARCIGNMNANVGAARAMSHMRTATKSATMGGGIFNLRTCIA